MGGESDAEVIARSIVDGEHFAAVFDRHFGRVHRYFAWRLGTDLADDLAGEVFRTAFERRATYDPSRGDCLPWLYGIATNLLRRQQRTRGRQASALARLPVAEVHDGHVDEVVDRVDAGQRVAALEELLRPLTLGERDVVLLVAWEGLSYEELAVALDVPLGTVRSRLHRARRKLREQLAVGGTAPVRMRRCAP